MRRVALLVLCGVASGMPCAQADEAAAMTILRAGYSEDAQQAAAVSAGNPAPTPPGASSPSTAPFASQTIDLSNQYDHAWLTSVGEYVLIDELSINPDAQLSGNWNKLRAVRPSP